MNIEDLLKTPAWQVNNYENLESRYWQHIRDFTFDPKEGSKFWIDRAEKYKVNPSQEFSTLDEFLAHPISDYDEGVIKTYPPEYFIPKRIPTYKIETHTSSGSEGTKKETYWSEPALEYIANYGDYIFDRYNIPKNINWDITGTLLFIDIMKKIVKKRNGTSHVEVLQTRDAKKFLEESRKLPPEEFLKTPFYDVNVKPIMEFYEDTFRRCNIGGLVTELSILPALVNMKGFEKVSTIYLTGVRIDPNEFKYWKEKLPDKIFVSSYGHHQLGLCFANPKSDTYTSYYPPAPISLTYVVQPDNSLKKVRYGETGRVRIVRMDEALLWVQTERDYATRVKDSEWDGIKGVVPSWKKT